MIKSVRFPVTRLSKLHLRGEMRDADYFLVVVIAVVTSRDNTVTCRRNSFVRRNIRRVKVLTV